MQKNMNKYAETPGEGKAPYPGGSQKKSLTVWGGVIYKKIPGEQSGKSTRGKPMKKMFAYKYHGDK